MSNTTKQTMTYAELLTQLSNLTPEQLAQTVMWSGDERGGKVQYVWIAEEDWIGESSNHESWLPRSEAMQPTMADDYRDAEVCLPAGTVHLMVD